MTESLIIGNFAINFFNFPKHPTEKKMFWKRSEKDVLGEKKCHGKVTFLFLVFNIFLLKLKKYELLGVACGVNVIAPLVQ